MTPKSKLPKEFAELTCLQGKKGELFDRQSEQRKLIQAFRRCRLSNRLPAKKEFVLIYGRSGTGKTCLAQTLETKVTSQGGYFLKGKFDQLQLPDPFAPLVAAFTDFVNIVLKRGPEEVEAVAKRINEGIALEMKLLLDTIPAFELILGPKEGQSYIRKKSTDYESNLQIMLRKLVRAICSPSCPMVLLVDDLQWSDSGSLRLLESLITDRFSPGLMIVGTCRDNEVNRGHHVAKMLCRFEDQGTARICKIELFNLSRDAVHAWMSSAFELTPHKAKPLSDFIYKQTHGNFYFLLALVKFLYEEGILYVYPGTFIWEWDEEELQSTVTNFEGVDDLEPTMMRQLPIKVKEVLKMAACIGAEFDQSLLCRLLAPEQVDFALRLAEDREFVVQDMHRPGWYRFCHDRIQQGAYSLIPNEKKQVYHLWFGRTLYDTLSQEEVYTNVYLIVNHLAKAKSLIKEQDERDQVALLCLRAGEQAIKSSDFVTSGAYLKLGIDFLGRRHWRDQFRLSLELYNAAAEVECCLGNVQRMDKLIDEVIRNVPSLCDQLRVYTARVHSLSIQNKLQDSLDLGFEILGRFGELLPKKVGKVQILKELFKARRSLKGKTAEELLALPSMNNKEKLCAIQLINMLLTSCFFLKPELMPLLVGRMIRITLKHGLAGVSSTAFALYGAMLCGNLFREFEEGNRYARLAISIMDRFKQTQLSAIVASIVYGFVFPWSQPMQKCLESLTSAIQDGFYTGDISSAAVCVTRYSIYTFHNGTKSLGELEKEMRTTKATLVTYKQEHIFPIFFALFRMVLSFTGNQENDTVLVHEMNDAGVEVGLGNNATVAYIWLSRALTAYYFNDYETAGSMCAKGNVHESSTTSAEQLFYEGLIYAALAQKGTGNKQNFRKASKCLKKLKKLSSYCPNMFTAKIELLAAEIETIKGNAEAAMAKFQAAMDLSSLHGYKHEMALASERMFLAARKFGYNSRALTFADGSILAYKEWGAHTKARKLEGIVASLRTE